MTDNEEEFRPNPFYDPLTADEHQALATELEPVRRRLGDLADELIRRYRWPSGVGELACRAYEAVGWLALGLEDQFIRDDPEHADHIYPTSGLQPPQPPCECDWCQRQRQEQTS